MPAKIFYSREFFDDLAQITDYISNTLMNPSAARNVVLHINERIIRLKDFPQMGRVLYSSSNTGEILRLLNCGNYVVLYRYADGAVHIENVVYARSDYLNNRQNQ